MSILGKIIGEGIAAAQSVAEQEGLPTLNQYLADAGYAVATADEAVDEHPVVAGAVLIATLVAATTIGPEVLATAATDLAAKSFMQEIIPIITSYTGIGSAIGQSIISAASTVVVDTVAGATIEQGVKALFGAGNALAEALSGPGSQPFIQFSQTKDNAGNAQLVAALANGSSIVSGFSGTLNDDQPAYSAINNVQENLSSTKTYNDDGSTDKVTYAAANFQGQQTKDNYESSDGSSALTSLNANGSSITNYYSGASGSGDLTGRDVERANGTSALTTFDASGETTKTVYSGPNGTGGVVSSTSTGSTGGTPGSGSGGGSSNGSAQFTYTGNSFTGRPPQDYATFTPGNVSATFVFTDIPANYTGEIDPSKDSLAQHLASWSISSLGETINSQTQAADPQPSEFDFQFQNGQIAAWAFDAKGNGVGGNFLGVSSGNLDGNSGDTANLNLDKQAGYTGVLGLWAKS